MEAYDIANETGIAVGNDTIDGDKVGDSETFDFEFGDDDAAEKGDVEREFGDSETFDLDYMRSLSSAMMWIETDVLV